MRKHKNKETEGRRSKQNEQFSIYMGDVEEEAGVCVFLERESVL